jgi:hypothetical protein
MSGDILIKQNSKCCQLLFTLWAEYCSKSCGLDAVKSQVKYKLSLATFRHLKMWFEYKGIRDRMFSVNRALVHFQNWQSLCKISRQSRDIRKSMTKYLRSVRHQHLISVAWTAFQLNLPLTSVLLFWGKFVSFVVRKAGSIKLRREAGIRMYQIWMLDNMRANLEKKLICLHTLKDWQYSSIC